MQTIALTLVLALTAPLDAPVEAPLVPEGASIDADPAPPKPPSAQRVWGVGLLAGGSALLAASATSAALVDAVTRPDDRDQEVQHPELLQSIAFGTMVVAAASVGAMLAGGALVLAE